jgi:hypothetical protein
MNFWQATLFGLSTFLLLGSAYAQQPSADQTNAIRQSCRTDFMANCSGVQPGGADALACSQRNLAKLSAPCKTAVSAASPAAHSSGPPAAAPPAAAKPAAAANPATAPAAKLNPPPPPPPEPAAAVAPTVAPLNPRLIVMPERRLVILTICHADREKLCSPSIPEEMIKCLAAQASKLSPTCYDAIARISR